VSEEQDHLKALLKSSGTHRDNRQGTAQEQWHTLGRSLRLD